MSNLSVNHVSQVLIDQWLKEEQDGERFPVPFDTAWQIAGYFKKANGKRKLSKFKEGIDFCSDLSKTSPVGRSSEFIRMTCDAFKHFCLLAETEQGDAIRQYFIECEKKWRMVQEHSPEVASEMEVLKIKLELAKQEAIAAKANEKALCLRHYVATTLPEPVQQKILGYTTVKEVEYRDRIVKDDEVINAGDTINKTALCYRYGFLTRNGKPDYKKLNLCIDNLKLPSEAWKLTAQIRENQELHRDYLEYLDRQLMGNDRQLWIGE